MLIGGGRERGLEGLLGGEKVSEERGREERRGPGMKGCMMAGGREGNSDDALVYHLIFPRLLQVDDW